MISADHAEYRGLIQVFTGEGKGKTSAAFGLAVRAVGAGLKVAIVYFDKGGDHYSERQVWRDHLAGQVDFWVTGVDRIDPQTEKFRFGVSPEDKVEARRGLDIVQRLLEEKRYDVLILDEINTAVHLGLLDESAVLKLLESKPKDLELVLTGRGCPAALVEQADLVSEVKCVRHPYNAGCPAREGLEY